MLISALLCAAATIGTVTCHNKFEEPLTITMSSKIWNLLETNAHVINAVGNNITIPKRNVQNFGCSFHIQDGRVKHLSLLKYDASILDFRKGVHLRMNAQFSGTVRGKALGFTFPSEAAFRSTSSIINVILEWNDFSFVTKFTSVISDVHLPLPFPFFMCGHRVVGLMRQMITSTVNNGIQRMIVDAVEQQLNPFLQKLKKRVIAMGYTQYQVEWTVHGNILRIVMKPRSWNGVVSAITPIDSMVCINGIMPAMTDEDPEQSKAAAVTNGTDFACMAPEFNCGRISCSVCTDLKVVVSNSTDVQL
ncbi:hypothetical protein Aduo_015087 [Ancylostoma duodenale]